MHKPDVETLNRLFQEDKRSRNAIFIDAGLNSGGRLFLLWERGGLATLETLTLLEPIR